MLHAACKMSLAIIPMSTTPEVIGSSVDSPCLKSQQALVLAVSLFQPCPKRQAMNAGLFIRCIMVSAATFFSSTSASSQGRFTIDKVQKSESQEQIGGFPAAE